MFHSVLHTSWQHIARLKYVALGAIIGYMILFLTILVGWTMIRTLMNERDDLTERFTYPLFISNLYSFDSPRVQDFIQTLDNTGITGSIQYITKQEALDAEVQKDPSILEILSGDNPLPDSIMIPLYGTDIRVLWGHIQEYRDVFDGVQSPEALRARLLKFQVSLREIDKVVNVLQAFIGMTLVLMAFLVFGLVHYYTRIFHHERIIARLVGANPIFIWGPHIIVTSVCMIVGLGCAYGLFYLLSFLIS